MPMGILFWVLMLLLLIGWGYSWNRGTFGPQLGGVGIIAFLLFLLLGWRVFGPPLQ